MKKIKHLGFIMLLAILLILSSKSISNATFYINNFDIRAEVKQNGDMEITESIQYYSDETKNGVTREIKTKNEYNSKNSADSLTLEEVLVDNYKARQVYSGTLGENGVYEYNQSGYNHSLKVYMPMSALKQNRTVTYKYTLTNVAVKYNDIAEIFWNFIGKEWDTEIKNVHIRVVLPYEAVYDSIYVYGHGSDNGRFEKNNNIIDLYATDLDAYQALDARILFSKTAIPQSVKEIDKSVLNKYINEEEGITKEYEQAEILAGLTINEIAIGLSAVIILTGIYLYFKFDKEYKVEKHHYYREIPHNLTPEILQTVYYGKVQKNAFFITFLNLIKKGVYAITKTQNEIGKETQLITYNEDNNQELEDYEVEVKKIINTFFDKGEKSIDTLKLQQKMKYSSKMYYRDYIRKLESRKEGLFGEKQKLNKKVTKYLVIAMVVLILFMVFIAFWAEPGMALGLLMFLAFTTFAYTIAFKSIEPNAFTIGFFTIHCGAFQIANIAMLVQSGEGIMYLPYALLFILLQYAYRIERTSIEERQIKEELKGLRRYIKDYSYLSTKEEIQEISLWEDYFIMAIALGLNENVVNYFYDYCKENINDDFGNSLIAFSSYGIMRATMASSFISYANRALVVSSSRGGSSYSGSSGGFSGGSSSGGGGRRRRRRKLILKRQWLYITKRGKYENKNIKMFKNKEIVLIKANISLIRS